MNSRFKGGLSLLCLVTLLVSLISCGVTARADGYNYEAARSMLALINEARTSKNAWYWKEDNKTKEYLSGLSALKYDSDLEKVAMLRAKELATAFSHTRPDGTSWSTAFPAGNYYKGENLACGYITAQDAFNAFMEENQNYAGQGHRRNMLRKEYTRIGIGCVTIDGTTYWAQALASGKVGSTPVTTSSGDPGSTIPEGSNLVSSGPSGGAEGWLKNGNEYRYRNSNGTWAKGWLQDGGKWYYLDKNGIMVTGSQTIGGKRYYFTSGGAMATGWTQLRGKWYYFGSDGVAGKGWLKDGGKWYYLDEKGAVSTGWVKDGKKWYFFDASGVMTTGWVKEKGKWYYTGSDGVMQKGWKEISGVWYYFMKDGVMATGKVTIDGKTEVFSSNGSWKGTEFKDYDTPLGTENWLLPLLRLFDLLEALFPELI